MPVPQYCFTMSSESERETAQQMRKLGFTKASSFLSSLGTLLIVLSFVCYLSAQGIRKRSEPQGVWDGFKKGITGELDNAWNQAAQIDNYGNWCLGLGLFSVVAGIAARSASRWE
jgi:hypothetical protein